MASTTILRSLREPASWHFTPRAIAVRLFLSASLLYALHFSTNIVREHYLAIALGESFSFRVDAYRGLHPDLFETPALGWHINSNPGASMLAAIPYAPFAPLVSAISQRVQQGRLERGETEPPGYDSPWANNRAFFAEAWKRGFDVKLGIAALLIHLLVTAPMSALSVVLMFAVLRAIVTSDRKALMGAVLYGFATPVFFRSGYLNHNLILGQIAFAGFVALWAPGARFEARTARRFALAGLAGGTALLFDYSGVVLLLGLFAYGLLRCASSAGIASAIRHGALYVLGSLPPVLLLWLYQWQSFGHPFLPAQRWMPEVTWSGAGWRGVTWPQPDLLLANLIDYRFGLFVSCPLLLLAFAQPFVARAGRGALGPRECRFVLLLSAAFWLFCGSIAYGRLQFNTGVRYMTSILPFLFLLAFVVWRRLPATARRVVAVASVSLAWCMAMVRDVERGFGVLDPVLHVLLGGWQLPALTTASRMSGALQEYFPNGPSPLPLFAFTAALLVVIWRAPRQES